MLTRQQATELAKVRLGGSIVYRRCTITPWQGEQSKNWWVDVNYSDGHTDSLDIPSDLMIDAIRVGKKEVDSWIESRKKNKKED